MNKNLSITLNIVLLVAVAVLYYLHFSSSGKNTTDVAIADSTISVKPIVMSPKEIKASKIVYINIDVLSDKYDFVKELAATAQAKQQRLETTYQTKAQKLQQDYADYQQKASQGALSENQTKAAQEDLTKRKAELDQMDVQLQALGEENQKSTEEAHQAIVDYIKEYNKNGAYNYVLTYTSRPGGVLLFANDSLDITNAVVNGLNEQYKAKKGKK